MTISKRTLEKWRKEALCDANPMLSLSNNKLNIEFLIQRIRELSKRILTLTMALLDQHLLNKG